MNAIESACDEAITRANRRTYLELTDSLSPVHYQRLDDLLKLKEGNMTTWLAWLRQSPSKPNSRHMLEHIERIKALKALDMPEGIARQVHQNRLLNIAREGGQMTPADLARFEKQGRYTTLISLDIEGMSTVNDEIIDLHNRILGKLFNTAKNKHQQQFQGTCRVGDVFSERLRIRPCPAGGLLATRIGLADNGADVFPVEAFISLATLDVFQVAADCPLREELLSLLAADGLLPNQPRQPWRVDSPPFRDAEGLSEIGKITKGCHVLNSVIGQVADQSVEIELSSEMVHAGAKNRVTVQSAPESHRAELPALRQVLAGEIDGNFLGCQIDIKEQGLTGFGIFHYLGTPTCFVAGIESFAVFEAETGEEGDQRAEMAPGAAKGVVVVIGQAQPEGFLSSLLESTGKIS